MTSATEPRIRAQYSACQTWEQLPTEDGEPQRWRGWDGTGSRALLVVTNGWRDSIRFVTDESTEPDVFDELAAQLAEDIQGIEPPPGYRPEPPSD